jgi:hypothetical protein
MAQQAAMCHGTLSEDCALPVVHSIADSRRRSGGTGSDSLSAARGQEDTRFTWVLNMALQTSLL